MTVRECKHRISSMEFIQWIEYLEQDMNGFHREDYFLAQIAYMQAIANAKNPKSVKFDSFLMKFDRKKSQSQVSEEQVRFKMLQSRAVWGAVLGVEIPNDDLRPDEPDILKGPWED